MNYGCAAAIGAVSGLRSMSGPAIVAEAANRNLVHVKRTPLSWLALDSVARTSALLAAGELIADKLPFMPDRTETPSLAWRAVSGAFCGYAVCGKGHSRKEAWTAALVAGTAALAASWIGLEYRRRVKLPPLVAALLEDAIAIGSGSAVMAVAGAR